MAGPGFAAFLIAQDAVSLLGLALLLRLPFIRLVFEASPFAPSQIVLSAAVVLMAMDILLTVLAAGDMSVYQYPFFAGLTDTVAGLFVLAILGFRRR
jgi:hypothetical protein